MSRSFEKVLTSDDSLRGEDDPFALEPLEVLLARHAEAIRVSDHGDGEIERRKGEIANFERTLRLYELETAELEMRVAHAKDVRRNLEQRLELLKPPSIRLVEADPKSATSQSPPASGSKAAAPLAGRDDTITGDESTERLVDDIPVTNGSSATGAIQQLPAEASAPKEAIQAPTGLRLSFYQAVCDHGARTPAEAREIVQRVLGIDVPSPNAAQLQLHRLKKAGWLAKDDDNKYIVGRLLPGPHGGDAGP